MRSRGDERPQERDEDNPDQFDQPRVRRTRAELLEEERAHLIARGVAPHTPVETPPDPVPSRPDSPPPDMFETDAVVNDLVPPPDEPPQRNFLELHLVTLHRPDVRNWERKFCENFNLSPPVYVSNPGRPIQVSTTRGSTSAYVLTAHNHVIMGWATKYDVIRGETCMDICRTFSRHESEIFIHE